MLRLAIMSRLNSTIDTVDSKCYWFYVKKEWTYLMQELNVYNTKNENEFVEYKIPKLVFQMLKVEFVVRNYESYNYFSHLSTNLLFGNSQFTEDNFLYRFSQQNETTIRHVDECLERKWKFKFCFICSINFVMFV